MDKLISVIVPIYNVEKYLADCVDSILCQTYSNFELILVDDESPDNAGQMCDELSKQDSRIKVIHKKNGGLSDARNAGLDICTGGFIVFIDSDDYVDKDYLMTLLNLMVTHGCSVAQIGTNRVTEDRKHLIEKFAWKSESTVLNRAEIIKGLLTRDLHCAAWCNMYRKELFEKVRFEKGKLNEDLLMWNQLIDGVDSLVVSNICLYNYRVRNGSLTNSTSGIKCYRDAVDNATLWKMKVKSEQLELQGVEDYNLLYYCLVYLKLYGKYDQESATIIDKVRELKGQIFNNKFFTIKERITLLAFLVMPGVSIPLFHRISFGN